MNKKLELIVLPNPRKRKEFIQSLDNLTDDLKKYCTSLMINESKDSFKIHILAQWETEDQMREALRSEEFRILSGAVNALCEKAVIRLNDKQRGNHISILSEL